MVRRYGYLGMVVVYVQVKSLVSNLGSLVAVDCLKIMGPVM